MVTTVSITDFGAKGDGRTNNQAAIQKAIDHAKAKGLTVSVPAGTFLHKGMLHLDGVDMVGTGSASVLKAVGASRAFDQQAIILRGNGASLKDIALDSDATMRGFTGNSAKVQVVGATDFAVSNVTIRNSMGAGIIVLNSGHGRIADNRIDSTNADSIHITRKSHHITVENNHITNGHDDGIAVVSYAGNGGPVNAITIRNNTVLNNQWGRNISVIGGENVTVTKNHVEGNAAQLSGIMVASEPRYNILGVKNVLVEGNVVKATGGFKTGQGAVMVYNGNSKTVEGVTIRNNEIVDAGKNGVFVRGDRIDDVTVTDNLILDAKAGAFLKHGKGTDVVFSDNATSRGDRPALSGTGRQAQSVAAEAAPVAVAPVVPVTVAPPVEAPEAVPVPVTPMEPPAPVVALPTPPPPSEPPPPAPAPPVPPPTPEETIILVPGPTTPTPVPGPAPVPVDAAPAPVETPAFVLVDVVAAAAPALSLLPPPAPAAAPTPALPVVEPAILPVMPPPGPSAFPAAPVAEPAPVPAPVALINGLSGLERPSEQSEPMIALADLMPTVEPVERIRGGGTLFGLPTAVA